MKKLINFLAIFIIASVILYGCNSGGGSSSTTTPPKTTVLVYVLGTDLETNAKAATNNILEMESVGSSANLNVVIQTGGSKALTNSEVPQINWSHAQRFLVQKNNLESLVDLGPDTAVNMGTESALANFIKWGVESFPAQKYILVLWDHGGGPNLGIGSDELTESMISMPQIINAVSQSGKQFEIIGFDACLMGSAEVAAGLRNYAQYMVGSEDVEPGGGWDYTPFLQYVTNNPSANGAQVGTAIANGYLDKMNALGQAITLSVIDLSKIQALIDATGVYATALMPYIGSVESWEQVALARNASLDFSTSAFFNSSFDLVDMQQWVGNVVNNVNKYLAPDLTLTAAGDAVAAAIKNAVVYKVETKSNLGATGLTVYFPSILYAYPDKNYALSTSYIGGSAYFSPKYTESSATGLVQAYYNYYYRESNQLVAAVSISEPADSTFSGTITNNYAIAMAANGNDSCHVYYKNNGSVAESTTACYTSMIPAESMTQGSGRNWSISFNKTNLGSKWVFLNGESVPLVPDTSTAKGVGENEYMIPVYTRKDAAAAVCDGKAGYLRVAESSGTLQVIGFQQSAEVPGKTFPLDAGEAFELGAYADVPDSSGNGFYCTANRITVSQESTVALTRGATSGANFAYIVNDLTGAVWISNSVAY